MKNSLSLLPLSTGALILLAACGENRGNPDYNPAVGPFDENGNYVEAWADNPPKYRRSRRAITSSKTHTSKSKPNPAPTVTTKPKTTTKPKSKPVKAKPRFIRHAVKKGDTLYGLARKYKSSVSKIQKANKLRGSNIIIGTTLVIPR